MNVGTNGIVVDQHGNVLLIKRNDTRTYAPPGGSVDAGELPSDAAIREVREETGLIVMPVRLAAVTFLPLSPEGFLGFSFRCLLRGGDITTSEESPVVGFFKANPLPRRMTHFHRERVEKTLNYAEERPLFFKHAVPPYTKVARFLLRNVIYRWMDAKRALQRKPPYQAPPAWNVHTYLLLQNAQGEYLWQRPNEHSEWRLPGGQTAGLKAPWETAVNLAHQQTNIHLKPQQLCDVFLGPGETQLSLVFSATTDQIPQPNQNSGWISPNDETADYLPQHQKLAKMATPTPQPTQFHRV